MNWENFKKPFCLFLFVATLLSTSLAQGPAYGVTIVFILLAHEMGHYWMSKKYQIDATWPYFVPMPNIFGTMGAIISIQQPMPNRKTLFDIGIAGPIAGLIFAIPALVYGISQSHFAAIPQEGTYMVLGEPLLFQWLVHAFLGAAPAGQHIVLHPVGFAAWAILFITLLNMIPIGQLDGGHVCFAILGKRARLLAWSMVGIFIYLGVQYHPLWLFFLVITVLASFHHPEPLENSQPVGFKRVLVALALYAFMLLCFSPIPFELKIN